MGILESLKSNMSTSGELLRFFVQKKQWWLVPMIALLLVFRVLIVRVPRKSD